MKGIVFTEFIDLVESRFSLDIADQMIEGAELASGGVYTAVGTYPHSEMAAMVVKLSELTGVPVPDLIRAFGEYLFHRFTQHYPHFFDNVEGAFDFLVNLESVVHAEVRKLYPEAELPRFDVKQLDGHTLSMVYRSDRHLADLAHGLLLGCSTYFDEPLDIRRHHPAEQGSPVEFTLVRMS
ncbi:MAG: heme NO-binding domain-containing protein [Burkholderiales bacterium]|nr:heme NO-binding domain-containing protein [Burkholderiales bacterium]